MIFLSIFAGFFEGGEEGRMGEEIRDPRGGKARGRSMMRGMNDTLPRGRTCTLFFLILGAKRSGLGEGRIATRQTRIYLSQTIKRMK